MKYLRALTSRSSSLYIYAIFAILAAAFILRIPSLGREMTGLHSWKNIRHYQFAQTMMKTHNPMKGYANFNQPEVTELIGRTPWSLEWTEAPLVDWALVATFKIFGTSVHNLHMVFILITLAGILLFAQIVRAWLGLWAALLGSAILAITPLAAYFAGHAVGENYLYMGQVLFAGATAALLAKPESRKRYVQFLLATAFLAACKLTTGLIMAATGFGLVHVLLLARQRQALGRFVSRHRWAVGLAGVVLVLGIAGLSWKFFNELDRYLAIRDLSQFNPQKLYIIFMFWKGFIGWFWVIGFAAALMLAVGMLWARWFVGPDFKLTAMEQAAMILVGTLLASLLIQTGAYSRHEYYSVTALVPSLLLILAVLERLRRINRVVFGVALVSFVVGLSASGPAMVKAYRYLVSYAKADPNDRAAIKQFFKHRKSTGKKYFIITRTPSWAYYGDVNMLPVYDWPTFLQLMEKTPKNLNILKTLGIRYVLYPTSEADNLESRIPAEMLEKMRTEPLIDLGPNRYKLGLVYRGQQFGLYKITEGIAGRRPLQNGFFNTGSLEGWTLTNKAFGQPQDAGQGQFVMHSADKEHGCLASAPFKAEADALIFWASSSRLPDLYIALEKNGQDIYRQRAITEDRMSLHAFDLDQFYKWDVSVKVVDAMAWEYGWIQVTGFEQISYKNIY